MRWISKYMCQVKAITAIMLETETQMYKQKKAKLVARSQWDDAAVQAAVLFQISL